MSYSRYYNRSGFVILVDGKEIKDSFRGLNFKFTCEFADSPSNGVEAKCTVGILGLTGDRVHELTTFSNGTNADAYAGNTKKDEKDKARRKFISVFAGYDGDGFDANTPLFTMPIIGAWPTSPPNMWLNFSGMNGAIEDHTVFDARMQSRDSRTPATLIPLKRYIEFVAEGLNAKVDWPMTEKEARSLEYNWKRFSWGIVGTESQIIRYLNETVFSWRFFIGRSDDDPTQKILHVWREPYSRNSLEYSLYRPNPEASEGINSKSGPTISAATGMLGFPKVTFGNGKAGSIEVKTLLRKDVGIGKNFTVKSDYIRFANSTFICNKIKHEGEYRGSAWYTTLYGVPPEAFGKSKK